jgi:membrane-bound ClpP family serine protease
MCHLILLLPLVALPVWWLLPLGDAAVVYGLILVVSFVVYWFVMKALHAPVLTGTAPLRGATGSVLRADGREGSVWVASELWSALSTDGPLAVGDQVEVVGVSGLTLEVRKVHAAVAHAPTASSHV